MFTRSRFRILALTAFGTMSTVTGCAGDPAGSASDTELQANCGGGKCDSISSLAITEINKPGALTIGNLLTDAVSLGQKELDKGTSTGVGGGVSLKAAGLSTYLFGLTTQNSGIIPVQDINHLVSNMSAQFGDTELSTAINKTRADFLSRRATELGDSSRPLFAESKFQLGVDFAKYFSESNDVTKTLGIAKDKNGADSSATVGFGFDIDASLQTSVISAYDNRSLSTLIANPWDAIAASRGFVVPFTLDHFKSMKPGEAVSIAGNGHVTLNFGAGAPILVANIASGFTNTLAIHIGAGLSTQGMIDVQYLCTAGTPGATTDNDKCTEITAEVGLTSMKDFNYEIDLTDSWGVNVLKNINFSLGPVKVDVAKILNNTLENALNAKLQPLKAQFSQDFAKNRLALSRFRVLLNNEDSTQSLELALAHMRYADIRLAQSLSAMRHPGMKLDFEILRAGKSRTTYAGVETFGMNFFVQNINSTGNVSVYSDDGTDSVEWDSQGHRVGWLFSTHGYKRTGLAAIHVQPDVGVDKGETNLFLQLNDQTPSMNRDQMLDHLDGIILGLGGKATLAAIEDQSNAMERYVESTCNRQGQSCAENILNDATTQNYLQTAVGNLGSVIGGLGLSAEAQQLLTQAALLRLAAQESVEVYQGFSRPSTSIGVDFRLDDATVAGMLTVGQSAVFADHLKSYLGAVWVDREKGNIPNFAQYRDSLVPSLTALEAKYESFATRYNQHLGIENYSATFTSTDPVTGAKTQQNYGQLGNNFLFLVLPTDKDGNDVTKTNSQGKLVDNGQIVDATIQSMAAARSAIAMEWFDTMRGAVGSLAAPGAETLPMVAKTPAPDMTSYDYQRINRLAKNPPGETALIYALIGMNPQAQLDLQWKADISQLPSGYPIYASATVQDPTSGQNVTPYTTGITANVTGDEVSTISDLLKGDGWSFKLDDLLNVNQITN